jgi:hypothetical protein
MDIFSAIALGILWAGMIISVISLFIMQLKIYNVLLQIRDTRIEVVLVKKDEVS